MVKTVDSAVLKCAITGQRKLLTEAIISWSINHTLAFRLDAVMVRRFCQVLSFDSDNGSESFLLIDSFKIPTFLEKEINRHWISLGFPFGIVFSVEKKTIVGFNG